MLKIYISERHNTFKLLKYKMSIISFDRIESRCFKSLSSYTYSIHVTVAKFRMYHLIHKIMFGHKISGLSYLAPFISSCIKLIAC